MVGVDPRGAFGNDNALLQLDWMSGTPQDALVLMKAGRACVVPDHFLTESRFVGRRHRRDGSAGRLDPVDWLSHRWCRAFAGLALAETDGHASQNPPRRHPHLCRLRLRREGFSSAATHVWLDYESDRVDPEAIQSAVGNLGSGDLDAKVIPVQTMRDHLQRIAHREIWLISQVLSIALGISCFAVLNVLMASVHSRRWEFGGLHAIGFTGSELVRSVLAEGIMIALAASLLGLGFGISFAWCGCELAQSFSFFGGLHLPLVVPWLTVAGSILLMITLVLLAAAWPAITIGSKRPLARFHRSADAL